MKTVCLKYFQFGIYVLIIINVVIGFKEDAIFEDEDIVREGLPPTPHTGLTAPGTKWCGPGTTASNYNDLGTYRATDMCCRQHDHCDEIIEAGSSLHNLQNRDIFPILKCSCEQTFLNCLQSINDMVSNTMGRVYFGTRGKCFNYGYPIISCKEYQRGTFRKRCIRYNVDDRHPKQWQYYDTPFYTLKSNKINSNFI